MGLEVNLPLFVVCPMYLGFHRSYYQFCCHQLRVVSAGAGRDNKH